MDGNALDLTDLSPLTQWIMSIPYCKRGANCTHKQDAEARAWFANWLRKCAADTPERAAARKARMPRPPGGTALPMCRQLGAELAPAVKPAARPKKTREEMLVILRENNARYADRQRAAKLAREATTLATSAP